MNIVTKNKWFLFLLGFLLLANVALLLSFFVFGEKSDPGEVKKSGQSPGYLSRELVLTQEQELLFKEKKEEHFKRIKPLWEEIRKTKDTLYRQLSNPDFNDSAVNAITSRLAAKNKLSDEMLFNHFRELRKLCSDEQKAKFDTLIPQMMTRPGNRGKSGDQKK